jgi:hypothetical protein
MKALLPPDSTADTYFMAPFLLRLPTDICSSINDSLAEINENAEAAYEQLKALLMSR